jgi:ABC-type multidrug transport system ATPase subunit
MDPISRRAVWDAIDAAKQHAAVVLTTHSMEEADALGDRIGIMVRGRMRVLGGSLTLKQKYGNGYQVGLCEDGLQLVLMLWRCLSAICPGT